MKKTIAVIVYAIVLLSLFVLGTFNYQDKILSTRLDKSNYQTDNLSNQDIYRFQTSMIEIGEDSIYENVDQERIILFGILLSSAVIFTFILVAYLRYIDKNEIREIIKNLKTIQEEEWVLPNNDLNEVYLSIRKQFENHFTDYKRLNAYLSHEQKNAIAAIRTRLEIDKQYSYLNQLDHVTNCINDVLTLSESGSNEILNTVDLALICAEVCDFYIKSYPNIIFKFNEEDNTEIYAKERWIHRAISNLIDNAIKYGEGKDIIVTIVNRKQSVIITVEDHGIGIEQCKLDEIFCMNYRVNELNKNGHGIGLSLVNHVCDLCGGYAYVESEIDQGTIFYITFPEYNKYV